MSSDAFLRRFPKLYHVADETALPGIQQHGVLSATALCDLFEVPAADRPRLLTHNRDSYVQLVHEVHGEAWLRRQNMRDEPLRSRLDPSISPGEWREFINSHVFLCTDITWAGRLRAAEPNRKQTILTWDTGKLLAKGVELRLSQYNNGSMDRSPPDRRRLRSFADYVPAEMMPVGMPVKEVAARGRIPFAVS